MVDCICMGLLDLQETQSEQEIQNEKFLSTVVEPVTSRLRSGNTTNCTRISDIDRALKSYQHFTWVCYLNLRVPSGKCTKMFVVYYIFLTLYRQETSIKQLKYYMSTIQDYIF